MTTLKDQIRAEASVFLNLKEFAEEILIEGVPTPAVCDWTVTPEGEHLYGSTGDTWGAGVEHAEIFLDEGIIITPEVGEQIYVNDKLWTVRRANPENGLLHLWLYRNVS